MSIETVEQKRGLTRYPLASFREFLAISIPLILLLVSGSLMGFCDRLFLSRYSIEALEACTSTLALCALFQLPAVRVVSISQAFIGKYKGSGDVNKIGPCVWQMIWLSLVIFLVALPLSFFAKGVFFENTSIAKLGIPYFFLLLPVNFLLPFGASLSSFYVGQGKTKMVLYATLCSHAVHLAVDPVLIFGIKGMVPSLGIEGAAIATVIGQTVYCAILLGFFLQEQNRRDYGTGNYRFDRGLFWECLKVGVPRSLSRIIILLNWTAVVRMLTVKGGNYLLVLSFGGSIHLLYIFVIEGMGQAIVTLGSYMVGIKEWHLIGKLKRNGGLFICCIIALLSIPYLFFPQITISCVFPDLKDAEALRLLRYSCYWSLVMFFAQAINSIWHNLLTAFHDTVFQMIFSAIAAWVIIYGVMFYAVEILKCSPDKIWLALSVGSFVATGVYSLRARKISFKTPVTDSVGSAGL